MPRRFPLLRDYEVIAEVGQGTLGTVYKVLGRRRNDLVAFKRIETVDAELRDTIKQAFRAAAALDHPAIVRPRDLGEDATSLWLVSDLIEGRTLLDFLDPPIGRDPERVKRAFYLFGQILKTLAQVHGSGLAHRGLKPTNLLVTRDAQVRMTDAGLTRVWDLDQTETAAADLERLTGYCAPEQLLGAAVDTRTDLYSVGLLLYEALAGRGPHDGSSPFLRAVARTQVDASPLATGDSRVDQSFGPLLDRLLARDRDRRPAGTDAVFTELGEAWDRYARSSTRPFTLAAVPAPATPALATPVPAPAGDDAGAITDTSHKTAPLPVSEPPPRDRENTQPFDRREVSPSNIAATARFRVSDLHIAAVLGEPQGDTFPQLHPVLVGRVNEMHRLEEALGAATAGRGRLVAVYGETGIGKTLLLHELANHARAQGTVVIVGRGSDSRRAARGPIVAMLDGLARRLEKLSPPEREQVLPPEASALSEISEAFRRMLPAEDVAGDPEYAAARRKYRLRVALAGLIRRLAERGPLLVTLEDLDEADHETIELIAHVARSLFALPEGERARAMLVVSYRSDEIDDRHRLSVELRKLADERQVQPIELDRLDERSTARLVAALLGVEVAPPPLVGHVWGETKGNPLFVVETVTWLREEGVLELRGGRLILDEGRLRLLGGEGAGRSLPSGLRDVVARRLERLSERALTVLRTAAVAGFEVRLESLGQATGLGEPDLFAAVAELVRTRFLLAPEDRPGTVEFDHARVREVVLSGIELSQRRATASRVAHVLEASAGDRRSEAASELGSLFDEAGDVPRALTYLALAAERHAHDGDLRGALKRWRRVAEILARLDDAARAPHRDLDFEARKKTARLLSLLGQVDLARRLYTDLTERAVKERRSEDEVDARNGLAETHGKTGDFAAAAAAATEALARAIAIDFPAGQAAALENLGVAGRRAADLKAASQHFRDALKIRRALGDEAGVARLLSNLGLVFRAQDNQDRAIAHFEEARTLYTRLNDRLGLAVTLSHLAGVHQRRNEYPRAVELYREARRHDEEIGNARGVALSNQGLGYVYLEEGDYRAALEHFERALGVFEHIGDRQNAAFALTNLGHAYYRTANHKEAAKRYRDAIAMLQGIGNRVAESEARSGLALTLAALGERVAAIEEANRAVEAARSLGARDKEAWARHTLAQVTGSSEQAALALALAEKVQNANLIFMVHHTLARLALDRGERAPAREHLQKAFTLIDAIAEKAGDARDIFLKKPAVAAVFRDADRL